MEPNCRLTALILLPAFFLASWPRGAPASESHAALLSSSHDSYESNPLNSAYDDLPVTRVPPLPPSRPDLSGFGYSYSRSSSSSRRQKPPVPSSLPSRGMEQEAEGGGRGKRSCGRALAKETARRWSTALGVIATYYLVYVPLKKVVGLGLKVASYFVVVHYIVNHVLGVPFHPERAAKCLPSSPIKLLYAVLARYFPLSAAFLARAHQAYEWVASRGGPPSPESPLDLPLSRPPTRKGYELDEHDSLNHDAPPPRHGGYLIPPSSPSASSMRHHHHHHHHHRPEDIDTRTWAERMSALRRSREEDESGGVARDDGHSG